MFLRRADALRPAGSTDTPHPAARHSRWHGVTAWLPAALLLVTGLAGLAVVSILNGNASGPYLVIAPPGASLADTINLVGAADSRLVQAGRFPNMVIAASDQPDFAATLRKAGAWLAIPAPERGGCALPSSQEKRS
ncbi:MAG: hypothetical protein AB7E60_06235 [Sphingobium sp.]